MPGPASAVVDGHVHFHHGFDAGRFLGAASRNLAAVARAAGGEGAHAVLMLTEGRGERGFERLVEALASGRGGGWTAATSSGGTALAARGPGGEVLTVVAGRQVATREGLEVLAYDTTAPLADGLDLDDTLAAVWESGFAAVVPWGFGKWWGRRGRRVREALDRHAGRPLALGDNAGRWPRSPEPGLFAIARERGIPVVPGSDPLPFASEAAKAGRFGCVVPVAPDPARPGASVAAALVRRGASLATAGRLERLPRFVALQCAMQWRKRAGRAAR